MIYHLSINKLNIEINKYLLKDREKSVTGFDLSGKKVGAFLIRLNNFSKLSRKIDHFEKIYRNLWPSVIIVEKCNHIKVI